jgi:hypothetical protein
MKNILLFILFVCSSNIIKAQDTLTMRSGENMLVKVIEVGTSEVKYKKLDNLNGPVFSILKSDLLMIKYENGAKDDFSSIKKIEEKIVGFEDLFIQGQNDAILNYDGYKTAGTSVLLSTAVPFYGIFIGIAPALLCSIAEPKDENLGNPNLNLMKNEQYANGYKQKAKQIKNKKVLHNYVSGIVIQASYLTVGLILLITGGGLHAW